MVCGKQNSRSRTGAKRRPAVPLQASVSRNRGQGSDGVWTEVFCQRKATSSNGVEENGEQESAQGPKEWTLWTPKSF